MSSAKQNLSGYAPEESPSAEDMSFGIVVADWNSDITHALLAGCKDFLIGAGALEANIKKIHVPGAFELPMAAKMMLSNHKLDAVICLGCVIKGETSHDKYINQAVAGGIMQLGIFTEKPVIFGVLTPNDEQQALDRAGGKHGNKGVEAAMTAIKMIDVARQIKKEDRKIGF